MKGHQGFTLIEIALAMAILAIGLVAAIGSYLTALRWAAETRHQLTAIDSAALVIDDATALTLTRNGTESAGFDNLDDDAKGWSNGYFITRDILSTRELERSAGSLQQVRVTVYAGGDDSDGELVTRIDGALIINAGYSP